MNARASTMGAAHCMPKAIWLMGELYHLHNGTKVKEKNSIYRPGDFFCPVYDRFTFSMPSLD